MLVSETAQVHMRLVPLGPDGRLSRSSAPFHQVRYSFASSLTLRLRAQNGRHALATLYQPLDRDQRHDLTLQP